MTIAAFYWAIGRAYSAVFGRQQMLHYPMFVESGQTLIDGQECFSDYVVSQLGGIADHDVLEIGCGNGVQAIYLASTHHPKSYHGIDVYPPHVKYARDAAAWSGAPASFAEDDAQQLATISDASADAILCVESAHHYPDKVAFLNQVRRVLRPGARFAIAELVSLSGAPSLYHRLTNTHCWTERQWRDSITKAGLEITTVDDVTDKLLAGLSTVNDALPGAAGAKAWLSRLAGHRLVKQYRDELAGNIRYLIFTACRPPATA